MKIWEDQIIERDKTIVIIGPNGSGKTKYGIKLSQLNNCDHIGALRNIALPENLPMKPFQQAETEIRDILNRKKQRYWELSNEIETLFSKLMADDSASATRFRDLSYKGQRPDIEKTKIMELKAMWEELFPDRQIGFDGYVPKVKSEYMAGNEYATGFMSDGERVAMYLAARVLDSTTDIIIIDEPEMHFHSKLAVLFWDTLEKLRPSKKFVYITHNLEFALSRDNPIFLIVKPNQKPQIIEKASDIPQQISIDLLAAASLSIFAKRIVFCEGNTEKSKDNKLLTTWFNDKDSVIVPLSSCKNVIEAVLTYKKTDIIQNITVLGIIDQDYTSTKALDAIRNELFVLPFHEIESLILHEDIIRAVLENIGKSPEEIISIIKEVKEKAKQVYSKELINNTISERFKKEIEFQVNFQLRGIKSNVDDEIQKNSYKNIFSTLAENAEQLYHQCNTEVNEVLTKDYQDILKILPGKPLTTVLITKLGIKAETYLDIVCKLIKDKNEIVIKCLENYLPKRTI